MVKNLCALLVIPAIASTALATVVQVDVVGEVDFNGIRFGSFANYPTGTPATMSFRVDSNDYLNGSFPTRGYVIDPASFSLTIGAGSTAMPIPYPAGETPYFIIRDNDPAVDGFLLGSHPDVPFPDGVWTTEPALNDPTFKAIFSATYGDDPLSSLDILDALGTYTFDGLTNFNWGLEDGGFQPTGLLFYEFTISVVPAPATIGLLALTPVVSRRRRRAV